MTSREAYIALNMVTDIGSMRLTKLLSYFGAPERILGADINELRAAAGLCEATARRISCIRQGTVDKEIAMAGKQGVSIVTIDVPGYPAILKNISDPPFAIYVKGRLREDDALAIGIVGSRRASLYGEQCAGKFAAELVERGLCVVSGMARGVDTCAHRGALRAGGRTIAVMGSGFNHLYPPENALLAEKIAGSGAVITEFPMDTQPLRQNFPSRNRVISGMSLGVLVVEAARNSGALITAACALEQGREVFALPGKVDTQTSFGPHELIKDGAKLVMSVDDIIDELGSAGAYMKPRQAAGVPRIQAGGDAPEERVRGLICADPVYVDELVEKTGLDISRISDILVRLQVRKVVRQVPGNGFVRNSFDGAK